MDSSGIVATTVVIYLFAVVLGMVISYLIIKMAIVRALRKARHEERIEKMAPGMATWLDPDTRQTLGNIDPVDR